MALGLERSCEDEVEGTLALGEERGGDVEAHRELDVIVSLRAGTRRDLLDSPNYSTESLSRIYPGHQLAEHPLSRLSQTSLDVANIA